MCTKYAVIIIIGSVCKQCYIYILYSIVNIYTELFSILLITTNWNTPFTLLHLTEKVRSCQTVCSAGTPAVPTAVAAEEEGRQVEED